MARYRSSSCRPVTTTAYPSVRYKYRVTYRLYSPPILLHPSTSLARLSIVGQHNQIRCKPTSFHRYNIDTLPTLCQYGRPATKRSKQSTWTAYSNNMSRQIYSIISMTARLSNPLQITRRIISNRLCQMEANALVLSLYSIGKHKLLGTRLSKSTHKTQPRFDLMILPPLSMLHHLPALILVATQSC